MAWTQVCRRGSSKVSLGVAATLKFAGVYKSSFCSQRPPPCGRDKKELVFRGQVLFREAEGFLFKEMVLEAVKISLGHTIFSKKGTMRMMSFNFTEQGKRSSAV